MWVILKPRSIGGLSLGGLKDLGLKSNFRKHGTFIAGELLRSLSFAKDV